MSKWVNATAKDVVTISGSTWNANTRTVASAVNYNTQILKDALSRIEELEKAIKLKDLTSVQQQDVCNEARQDGYDQGLNDAWKYARKIAEREDDMRECFHDIAPARIFREYSASEAIAKIKGYEEKKKPGRWIYDTTIENWRCSKCGEILKTPGYVGTADFMEEHFKWCPHCGEKMEKEKL